MTEDDLRAHGLYQCPDCLSTFDSEKALIFCCDDRFDKPSYERSVN